MAEVRAAVTGDREAVLATVVAAFDGDPAWAFLLGPDYPLLAPLFAGALFDQRVGAGTVWILDDARSVAMWDAPGGVDGALKQAAWGPFLSTADAGARARLDAYDAALEAVCPAADFWYLGVLATLPGSRGGGGATRVLGPGLERADAAGLDCCLETSTTANREFYARRGFRDATEVRVPGGPPTWWLRRPSTA